MAGCWWGALYALQQVPEGNYKVSLNTSLYSQKVFLLSKRV